MADVLIHIGYHKTGTTWFQRNLFNNSAIRFALPFSNQELLPVLVYPHALDFDPQICRKHLQPALREAENRGLFPVLSNEDLSGNPHSGGYASKELADRLAAAFPEARVLIVIREQKSMIVSTYKQYVKVGGTCSLVDYLQPPTYDRQRIPLFDWDHFKYHRLIKYYLCLFGRSRVLVLPYEFFREHPSDFISQIIHFCGLETKAQIIEALPYSIKENESLSGITIALKRRLNRIISPRNRLNLRILIPLALTANRRLKLYWQILDSVNPSSFKEVSENRLKAMVAQLTGNRYKQSNVLTTEMLNLNLRQYGYDI